ncbi:CHAT domain-containing protein [Bacteroidia bacterium]|nr:CHAT domain-containing protein [Bacteroidia bacterium]
MNYHRILFVQIIFFISIKICFCKNVLEVRHNAYEILKKGDTTSACELVDLYVADYLLNNPKISINSISALYMAGEFYYDQGNKYDARSYFNKAFFDYYFYIYYLKANDLKRKPDQKDHFNLIARGSKIHSELLLKNEGRCYNSELSIDIAINELVLSGDTSKNQLLNECLRLKNILTNLRSRPHYIEEKLISEKLWSLIEAGNNLKTSINFYRYNYGEEIEKDSLDKLEIICQNITNLLNPENNEESTFYFFGSSDIYYDQYLTAIKDLARISGFRGDHLQSFTYYIYQLPYLEKTHRYKYSAEIINLYIDISKSEYLANQTLSAISYLEKVVKICKQTNYNSKTHYGYALLFLEKYNKTIGAIKNSRYYNKLYNDQFRNGYHSSLDRTNQLNAFILSGIGHLNNHQIEDALLSFTKAKKILGDSITHSKQYLNLLWYETYCYSLLMYTNTDHINKFTTLHSVFIDELKNILSKKQISIYDLEALTSYVCDFLLGEKLNSENSYLLFEKIQPYLLKQFNLHPHEQGLWLMGNYMSSMIEYLLKYENSDRAIKFIKNIYKNHTESLTKLTKKSEYLKEIALINYFESKGRKLKKLEEYINYERSKILADLNLNDQISSEHIFKKITSLNRSIESLMFNENYSKELVELNFRNRIEMQQMLTKYSTNRAKFSENKSIDSTLKLIEKLNIEISEAELREDKSYDSLINVKKINENKINLELAELELDTLTLWDAVIYQSFNKTGGQKFNQNDYLENSATSLVFCAGTIAKNGYLLPNTTDTILIGCYSINNKKLKWDLIHKLPIDSLDGELRSYNLRKSISNFIQKFDATKPIYYMKDPYLNNLSFNLLKDDYDNYIIEKYDLRLLSEIKNINSKYEFKENTDITLIGGVEYDTTSMDADNYEYGFLAALDQGLRSDNSIKWKYLPATKDEVNNINELSVKNGLTVNMKIGREPTEKFIRTLDGRSPSIIHIATHGFYFKKNQNNKSKFSYSSNPLVRCGLAFSAANNTSKNTKFTNDGILTGLEISSLDLRKTSLVVLSACETGLGEVKAADGIYGLQRAFKMAGVKYIILSLWSVPDKETKEFMSLFYSKWIADQDIYSAFRQTQLFMLNKYRNNPTKWAAFELLN